LWHHTSMANGWAAAFLTIVLLLGCILPVPCPSLMTPGHSCPPPDCPERHGGAPPSSHSCCEASPPNEMAARSTVPFTPIDLVIQPLAMSADRKPRSAPLLTPQSSELSYSPPAVLRI
jgi:hypothetical protein